MAKKLKAVVVIPARYDSTRFPGKPLADINGKPMIMHVYRNAKKAKELDDVVIATDDDRISEVLANFGVEHYMTSKDHQSGTDRIAEVVEFWDSYGIIVNIQGDEPLIRPEMLDDLIRVIKKDETIQVATLGTSLKIAEDLFNHNVVKIYYDVKGYAMKFFRRGREIVAIKNRDINWTWGLCKHIGIYAYRRDFLLKFVKLPKSMGEMRESLEQLRILDNGYKIKVVRTEFDTISVDTPEDLERVKECI